MTVFHKIKLDAQEIKPITHLHHAKLAAACLTGCLLILSACQPLEQPITSGLQAADIKIVSASAQQAEQTPSSEPVVDNSIEIISSATAEQAEPSQQQDDNDAEPADDMALKTDEMSTQTALMAPKLIEQKPVQPARVIKPVNQIGKTQNALLSLLGQPDIERREGGVITWQYQQKDCVVDFFFKWDENETVRPAIFSWDMRPRQYGAALDQRQCEEQLADNEIRIRR